MTEPTTTTLDTADYETITAIARESIERAAKAETELRDYRAYWEPVIKRASDEHIRQGGELATLRQLALDLLNQLTVLRMPDASALWRYGGQGLERAYQALRAAMKEVRE